MGLSGMTGMTSFTNTFLFSFLNVFCFPGETKIHIIGKGYIPIKDVKIGKEKDTESGETVFKSVSRTTQMKVPANSRPEIAQLRKELQAKFLIPDAVYRVKEDENGVYLSITNITLTQKANISRYLEDKGLLQESNWEMRKMLILAGIIK
jgi:hypothetical protein